jgi:hypothetical protein
MEQRICAQCHLPQDIENFGFTNKPKGYRRPNCKACRYKNDVANKERNLALAKIWRQNNPDKVKERDRKSYIKRAAKIKVWKKIYRAKNKAKIAAYDLRRSLSHKPQKNRYMRKYIKERKAKDPSFKLRMNVSAAVFKAINGNGGTKKGSSIAHLPYPISELRTHIEKQFEPWMTWNNYGKYDPKTWNDNDSSTWTWQLDHIIPHSKFNYTSLTDDSYKQAWALSNLRPYSAKLNWYDGIMRTRHTTHIS